MSKQKFHRGDRVYVAKNLGPTMSHFPSGMDGIVMGSYNDQYPYFPGEDHKNIYTIYLLPKRDEVSWYHEDQLTTIKGPHGRKLANRLDGREL